MQPKPDSLQDLREYPILYVDDEPENLRIFELTFRREFEIFTAESGDEGLEIIHTRPVALVLSDHRMPKMTGTEFLEQVAAIDPATIRIMVTAYGDAETLSDAINNGHIYRFIAKPWRNEDVHATLLRGIEAYALARERAQLLHELTILNRVSASLNQELRVDRLLALLVQTLKQDAGFDGAGVMLRDAKSGSLAYAHPHVTGDETDVRLEGLRLSHENAGRFMADLERGYGQSLNQSDLASYEPGVRSWVSEVAAEDLRVVPLFGKQGLIGAITADNRSGGNRFTADDCTLLEGMANLAATALDNARLVEDLRKSREQVRRSDRLGTLGTLAAGLAHEINNPLTSIHTFLSMAPAKRAEADVEFWGEYHALACKEVDRIRGLVETMRRLGQGGAGSAPREKLCVAEIANEVVTLLHREAELGQVDLRFESDPAAPKVVAARDQIHQVLLNLLLNALAATPTGGEIELRTGPDPAGQGVEFSVRDTGPGIPRDQLEQIFDPFFTTKGPDQGSGLGLMVCHRIVTDHGGTIEVESSPHQGACFRVRLPVEAPPRR